MSSYKQVIVLRDDIGMSAGKMVAQACHASLNAYKLASDAAASEWEVQGAKKIALKSNNLEELLSRAESARLPAYLVTDAGLTELEPGTVTALGIGPGKESKIDRVTGNLELID